MADSNLSAKRDAIIPVTNNLHTPTKKSTNKIKPTSQGMKQGKKNLCDGADEISSEFSTRAVSVLKSEADKTLVASPCLSAKKRTSRRSSVSELSSSGKKLRKDEKLYARSPASCTALQETFVEDYENWNYWLAIADSFLPAASTGDKKRVEEFLIQLKEKFPSLVHRCLVEYISRHIDYVILRLKKFSTGEKILAVLYGSWKRTEVKKEDTVNLIAELIEQEGTLLARIDRSSGFLILHPDVLIPGSAMPLGNDCVRRGYLNALLVEQGFNDKAVFGNLMHKVMQAAVVKYIPYHGQKLELGLEIDQIIQSSQEELFACGKTEDEAFDYISASLESVKQWLEATRSQADGPFQVQEVLDIEEAICAPQFGLKGRIDATVSISMSQSPKDRNSSHRLRRDLPSHRLNTCSKSTSLPPDGGLEPWTDTGGETGCLKAGLVVPMEFKTGRSWFTHDAQVMLYVLLLQTRYQEAIHEGLLWYLDSPYATKQIKLQKDEMDSILQARNHFSCYLKETRTNLPPTIGNPRTCQRCPYLTECSILHKALEGGNEVSSGMGEIFESETNHVSQECSEFLSRWLVGVDLEDAERKLQEPLSWNPDRSASKASGIISMRDLKLQKIVNKPNGWLYTFGAVEEQDSFPSEEFVLVSIENYQPGILKGFVKKTSKDSISVLGDACLPQRWQSERFRWRLDRFCSAKLAATQRTNLLELAGSQDPIVSSLRSLIIEKRPPQRLQDIQPLKEERLKCFTEGLNPYQEKAVKRILEGHEYILIWGMPGSGKTHTIIQAIQGLVDKGQSVLISSYTHSAVDNILLRLLTTDIPFLRLGAKPHVHPKLHGHLLGSCHYPKTSTSDLKKLMDCIQVVGVTCSSARHPLLTSKRFDVCIVDEASQILLPVVLAPLLKAKSFILLGDPEQLPPLIKTEEALRHRMDTTLFSILQEAHPEVVVYLRMQYRMCKGIMSLANHLVYNNQLLCANKSVANQILELPNFEDQTTQIEQQWIHSVLDPQRSVVMVDTNSTCHDHQAGESYANHVEAEIVVELIKALLQFGAPSESIGVITPYNGQVRLIQANLGDENETSVEVSTVDKFQGRDKNCIIVSFVRSNKPKETGSLLKDTRRINVAITRAKKKLILLGNISTLNTEPFLQKAIDYISDKDSIIKALTQNATC